MTIIEAREIVKGFKGTILDPDPSKPNEFIKPISPDQSFSDYGHAKGFIDAWDQQQKLIEAQAGRIK
jgi:hypothetical protein